MDTNQKAILPPGVFGELRPLFKKHRELFPPVSVISAALCKTRLMNKSVPETADTRKPWNLSLTKRRCLIPHCWIFFGGCITRLS